MVKSRVAKEVPHLAKSDNDGSTPRQLGIFKDNGSSKPEKSAKDDAKSS